MNEFDKLRTIITLKKLIIHHQYWELAAYLRDRERTEFHNISIDLSQCIKDNITISDYLYIIVVLDEWESYKISLKYEERFDLDTNIESVRSLVEKEFIDIIRQIKLSSILK
jgi:hypothetical protein